MSKFWDGAGIIAKKALTWACYGAVTLGILTVPFAAGGGLLSSITGIGSLGTTTLTSGLMYGAGLGALFGAIKGAADIPEGLQDLEVNRNQVQLEQQVAQDSAKIRRGQLMQQGQAPQQTVAQNGVNISPDGVVGNQRQGQGGVGQ